MSKLQYLGVQTVHQALVLTASCKLISQCSYLIEVCEAKEKLKFIVHVGCRPKDDHLKKTIRIARELSAGFCASIKDVLYTCWPKKLACPVANKSCHIDIVLTRAQCVYIYTYTVSQHNHRVTDQSL